jgi:hypothetical protein
MPAVTVNGTELDHEVRGSGPPALLTRGATGDGGHFDTVADLLADEFTVRSSAPAAAATSCGCVLIRHPEAVRGAILHEPALYALLDDPDAVRAPVRSLIQAAIEAGRLGARTY